MLSSIFVADSVRSASDSLLFVDSVPKKDSTVLLTLYRPLAYHGSLYLLQDSNHVSFEKQQIQFLNYTSLTDIVENYLPVFTLSQGYYGMMSGYSVFGGTSRDNALFFNGHNTSEILTGISHMEQMPVEFMEGAEVLTGVDAVILAGSVSGVAVNVREVRFNTKNPFTRIWYTQGGYGFGGSNGIFSQNVSANMNATIGYRRLGADGRFLNQWLDAWNVYGLFRWNVNDKTSISYSHIFTNYATGLNGGVNPQLSTDINDEVTAAIQYPDLSERMFKHCGTLLLTSSLANDSTSLISASVFGENTILNKERASLLALNENDSSREVSFRNYKIGSTIRYDQQLFHGLLLRAGGSLEFRSITPTQYNQEFNGVAILGFGSIHYAINDNLSVRSGIRYLSIGKTVAVPSIGGAVEFSNNGLTISVDASQSDRLPTMIEGANLLSEHHTLGIAKIAVKFNATTNVALNAFVRYVANPIVAKVVLADTTTTVINTTFNNDINKQVFGGIITASTRTDNFVIQGNIQTSIQYLNNVKAQLYPSLFTSIQTRYEYNIGNSLLFVGLSVQAHTQFVGERFIAINWSYVQSDENQPAAYNGIDINAGAKLGNAFIKATFQNILSSTYTTLSTFPQNDRNIRLSVAWSFFD